MYNTLVIGGSSGIGKELVKQLLNEGKKVINISRSDPMIENSALTSYQLDINVDNPEFPEIDLPISGLVYCPGSINLKPFRSTTIEQYQSDLSINFFGAIKVIKNYYKQLRKGNAAIVLFSTVAVQTGMAYHSSIAASKGAIEGMTRTLAAEFAPKMRVNAIAPSMTQTPLAAELLRDEKAIKSSENRHPLQQIGNPDHVAKLAAFLISDESSFITGQIIPVDGGISSVRLFKN